MANETPLKAEQDRKSSFSVVSIEVPSCRRLKNLTMTFEPDVTVIAGKSGVGKTTVLELLADVGRHLGSGRQSYSALGVPVTIETVGQRDQVGSFASMVYFDLSRVGIRDGRQFSVSASSHPDFAAWWVERDTQEALDVRDSRNLSHRDPQLEFVRAALARTDPFQGIGLRVKDRELGFVRGEAFFRWADLSSGERSVFTLLGELARREAIVLSGRFESSPTQIVLIDEIELHLHPAWQRKIIPTLVDALPGYQFIVTTHSPQVLGSVEARCIRALSFDLQGKSIVKPVEAAKGLDSNFILETIMEAEERDPVADEAIETILRHIDRREFGAAKQKLNLLGDLVEGDASILSTLQLRIDLAKRRAGVS